MPKKQKREGRKNSRRIGDALEIDERNFWTNEGFLCIRVPNPRRHFGAKFQQRGAFAKWDLVVVHRATVIQCKSKRKYWTKPESKILLDSFKEFPKTELDALLTFRDNGLKRETIG